MIALLRKNFFHPAGRTRTDVHFVHFDRARNGVASIFTRRHTDRQRNQGCGAVNILDLRLHDKTAARKRDFPSFRKRHTFVTSSTLPGLAPLINETTMAGYSGTPLPQKLGIKPGASVVVINGPKNYRKLLGKLPEGARLIDRLTTRPDFVHLFTARRTELQRELKFLRRRLSDTGTLWVSWPKKSAGLPTDVTEDTIREAALPLGLVDTKVCAVDEIWSGLKLMVRKENRKRANSSLK